ncbi:MAG: heavy metal translocating P-type ATPase, partial [Candidatus Methanoperedens sp.]
MKETIGIFGMTCMHCHKKVTDAISIVNGVKSVDVSLPNNCATVEFDEKTITKPGSEAQQSAQACPVVIEDDEGTVQKLATKHRSGAAITIKLKISGMTCAACAQNIEKVLKKLNGVESVTVNFSLAKAHVE